MASQNAPNDAPTASQEPIELSESSKALIQAVKAIPQHKKINEYTKITVSQAVSLFALGYEKVRNAIEYRDEHLIRRAAIERILRRRMTMNTKGVDGGESLIRELLWARYFPNGSLDEEDVARIQRILDVYTGLRDRLAIGQDSATHAYVNSFLFDMLTSEIEESLVPGDSRRTDIFTYFLFQTIKNKLKIEDVTPDEQNMYLVAGIERFYRKSDTAYARYHLFCLFYQSMASYTPEQLQAMTPKFIQIFHKIDDILANKNVEKMGQFLKKQLPPYLILFLLLQAETKNDVDAIVRNREKLWEKVEFLCRQKYKETRSKLNSLAVKTVVYIFLTKMLIALILEGPLSVWAYGHVDYVALAINTLFPPVLMLVIILTTTVPGADNTLKIFQRIVDILDKDKTYEDGLSFIARKPKPRRPLLTVGFTFFYVATFGVTLLVIHYLLSLLGFNLISEIIFIFFVSTVAFFGHRIRQVTSEYKLIEHDSAVTPFIDFFFMPILSLGKFFSSQVAKINVFTVIFDVIIEIPFKLIIEVIEEWIGFTKRKKEEIV